VGPQHRPRTEACGLEDGVVVMVRSRTTAICTLVLLLAAAQGVSADEAAEPTALAESAPVGVNIDLGLAGIYSFRGLNVFQSSSPMDQNALFAPSVTWSIFDTGLSLGYWGGYQATGDNIPQLIDAGLGAEQDFAVGYSADLPDDLSLSGSVVLYLYPFADAAAAGATAPAYLEPGVCLSWSDVVTLSLGLSYMAGLQDALAGSRYLYVNPSVSYSLPFGSAFSFDFSAGFGYKLFNHPDETTNNVFDVLLGIAAPIALPSGFYLAPSLNLAWTNLDGRSVGDEFSFWGGVNVGVDL
jgi:hypothetical protein